MPTKPIKTHYSPKPGRKKKKSRKTNEAEKVDELEVSSLLSPPSHRPPSSSSSGSCKQVVKFPLFPIQAGAQREPQSEPGNKRETDNKEIINGSVLRIKLRANYAAVIIIMQIRNMLPHILYSSLTSSYPRTPIFISLITCLCCLLFAGKVQINQWFCKLNSISHTAIFNCGPSWRFESVYFVFSLLNSTD